MVFVIDFSELPSGDMRVDLGGCDLAVPQHELHGPQIGASLEKMRGKSVAKDMGTDLLFQSGQLTIPFHHLPESLAGESLPPRGQE